MTILSTLEGVVVVYVVFVMNTSCRTLCSLSFLLVSHELMRYLAEMSRADLSGVGVGGMVDGSVGHYGNKSLCIKRD